MGHVVVKLPDVGEGTAQAELANWLVKIGDMVEEDQNLAEVTTDKATVEIPSPAAGKVVALHGVAGDVIAVGTDLIEIDAASGSDVPAEVISRPEPAPPANRLRLNGRDAPDLPALPSANLDVPDHHHKILASPAVRARAHDLRIELSGVVGTGGGGRIIHKDLDTYMTYQLHRPEPIAIHSRSTEIGRGKKSFEDIKIIGIRRKISERMQESKRNIPHYSYVEEVDVSEIEALRLQLNREGQSDGSKLSILPFIVIAIDKAIRQFPQVNAHFDDTAETLRQFLAVHIGIATQTDKGLMVPVVFDVDLYDLWGLSKAIASVAEAARSGKADRKILTGSTITVTSLGKLGGIVSTPVINRPEVAIVGVNKVTQRPIVRSGHVVVRSMMNLSSSFDHRIVDGWVAAAFIQKVKALLEQPALLFMETHKTDQK